MELVLIQVVYYIMYHLFVISLFAGNKQRYLLYIILRHYHCYQRLLYRYRIHLHTVLDIRT